MSIITNRYDSLKISAIRAFNDNYIWAIDDGSRAVIVDPGEVAPVRAFLEKNQLALSAILITHHHHDHVGGVAALQAAHPDCLTYAHAKHTEAADFRIDQLVDEGSDVQVLGLDFSVWFTPGHTDSHISYLVNINNTTHVFCADTLFSGGCDRVFTGTMSELHDSLMRFNTLLADTLFYPAHEYTASNLGFGLSVAGAHHAKVASALTEVKQKVANGGISLPTTLAAERQINVFLQTDDAELISRVAEQYPLTQTDSLSVL